MSAARRAPTTRARVLRHRDRFVASLLATTDRRADHWRGRGFVVAVVGALLLVIATPRSARADYRQAYLDGRAALARGNAAEAVRLLTVAASERPQEQARARLVGAIPEPYLPHHLLAVALARAGRCADALREWETSATQGIAVTIPGPAAEARSGVVDCRRKLGIADPAEAAATARAAVHTELLRALESFLAGNYSRTVELLESLPAPADATSRAWQLALRAAARHSLFRLGGEREPMLLAAAIADARDARRADPGFRPNAELFSPRFLELWSAQR